jgi:hypothetical protein
MGQEQTQMIIIANGTPIPNAPPTMFANAESKPNPRLNSLRRDMPLPPWSPHGKLPAAQGWTMSSRWMCMVKKWLMVA